MFCGMTLQLTVMFLTHIELARSLKKNEEKDKLSFMQFNKIDSKVTLSGFCGLSSWKLWYVALLWIKLKKKTLYSLI